MDVRREAWDPRQKRWKQKAWDSSNIFSLWGKGGGGVARMRPCSMACGHLQILHTLLWQLARRSIACRERISLQQSIFIIRTMKSYILLGYRVYRENYTDSIAIFGENIWITALIDWPSGICGHIHAGFPDMSEDLASSSRRKCSWLLNWYNYKVLGSDIHYFIIISSGHTKIRPEFEVHCKFVPDQYQIKKSIHDYSPRVRIWF